ncbi:unnamed protein product [Alopecurus aequalis]
MDRFGPVTNDGKLTIEFHPIKPYGVTHLDVVYTNEVQTLNRTLEKFEQWIEREDYKFVGLDIEFTRKNGNEDQPQKIAVIQIAFGQHVLVFHYCRCKETYPKLVDFFENKHIIRRDGIMFGRANITTPEKYHVDIQDMYKSEDKFYNNPPFDRDSMEDLAVTIIDKACGSFKTDIPFRGHDFWETKPLSVLHLEYAARDGFYSYELYRQLVTI